MFKKPAFFRNILKLKGFTLLELLVVVSIIGILIAIGTAAFSTAQKKSRDAKRRADIKTMQSGFEQYYAQNDGAYGATCAAMVSLNGVAIFPGGLPTDPKNSGTAYDCPNPATTTYCICATLELGGGNSTTNANCGAIGGYVSTNNYFCMTNLQ